MASFTDRAPEFKEYVSRMPIIETYYAVASAKQQAYDRNYQKIQEEIDKIAGLDIQRPADRGYLESKLNELNNKLKFFAVADFSNNALANSLAGMAKSISRDPIIRSALISETKRKNEIARIDADIKAGKYNPNNVNKFNKEVEKWYNSPNPGESFTASYFSPVDVWKKIVDVAKEVGVDEYTAQQLFKTDENGNPLYKYDSKGNPIGLQFNEVMVEKHLKGKDAGKILKAFQMALTPADYMQLAIDGEAFYANKSVEDLKADLAETYENQKKVIDNKILYLKRTLVDLKTTGGSNKEKMESIEAQIEYYNNYLEKLDESIKNGMKEIETNPDRVRATLYTNNFLFNASKALSSQEESTKYSVNPLWEVTLKENQFKLQLRKQQFDEAKWEDEKLFKEREIRLKELEAQSKIRDSSTFGVPTSIDSEDLVKQSRKNIEDAYNITINSYNDTNRKIVFEYFKDIYSSERPKYSSEEEFEDFVGRKMKEDLSKEFGYDVVVNPNTGAINPEIDRFAAKVIQQWKNNPESIKPEMRNLIDDQYNKLRTINSMRSVISDIDEKAKQLAKERGLNISMDDVDINPKVINVNGKVYNLTKEDLINFAKYNVSLSNLFGKWFESKDQENVRKEAEVNLRAKYGQDFDKINAELISRETKNFAPKGSPSIMVDTYVHQDFINFVHQFNKRIIKNYDKLKDEVVKESQIVKQAMAYPVLRGKNNESDFYSKLYTIVQRAEKLSDKSILQSYLQTNKTAGVERAFTVLSVPMTSIQGGAKYYLKYSNADIEPLEITRDEALFLGVPVEEAKGISPTSYKLFIKKNTNLSGYLNHETSWYTRSDFTNFKEDNKYELLGADYVKDYLNPSVVRLKIYVRNKETGDISGPVDAGVELPLTFEDGTINPNLDLYIQAMDNSAVKQIMEKNGKSR